MKPFSESCERNKQAILSIIKPLLINRQHLLEIGSGTGQHAVYFAEQLPHINWQTSDRQENHSDINLWLADSVATNIEQPLNLDVIEDPWPDKKYDAVFSANIVHIMPWQAVQACFAGVGKILKKCGIFMLYGPFNYKGEFTCESNRNFEGWLKSVDPERGIRDFEAVNRLAEKASMQLITDCEMPANNRILVWGRK